MAAVIPTPTVAVFDATGAASLGVLRAVASLTVSDVLSDMGSLKIAVPRSVAGAEFLLVDADRQVRLRMPECPDMWFLADEENTTFISDDPASESVELTLRSLAGVCDEAKVTAETVFTDATPGAIVGTLFTAAQALGLLENVTLAGDDTQDASGAAWPDTYTVTYKIGMSLLEVLKGLADLQLIEWRMNERTLEIYKPVGGLDRTLTVALKPRRDVTSAPYQRSKRAIATDVVVEGAEGATSLRSQSLPGRRRRMAYVSQTTAPAGSTDAIGDLYLAAHAEPDEQATHEVTDGPDTPVPWRDYRPGDRIQTLAAGDGVTAQRCAQIALTFSGTGSTVTLELGSLLATAEEVFDRKIRKLLPGDSN